MAPESSLVRRLRDPIDRLRPLADAMAAAGYEFALVGGMVRDALRGAPLSSDLDAVTDASPDEVMRVLAPLSDEVRSQGRAFGVIVVTVRGTPVEVATYRSESYSPTSRKPQVSFVRTLKEDLSRRDFTVNAMALTLPDCVLVDPFGGRKDLAASRLRSPSDPVSLFSDDPLRMFRAARFSASVGLVPDRCLLSAVHRCRSRISVVSSERVGPEIRKILSVRSPQPAVEFLYGTGLWQEWTSAVGLPITLAGPPPRIADSDEGATPARWASLAGHGRGLDDATVLLRDRLAVGRPDWRDARSVLSVAHRISEFEYSSESSDVDAFARSVCSDHPPCVVSAAVETLLSWRSAPPAWLIRTLSKMEDAMGPALRTAPLDGVAVMKATGATGPDLGRILRALRDEHVSRGPLDYAAAMALVSSTEWVADALSERAQRD